MFFFYNVFSFFIVFSFSFYFCIFKEENQKGLCYICSFDLGGFGFLIVEVRNVIVVILDNCIYLYIRLVLVKVVLIVY